MLGVLVTVGLLLLTAVLMLSLLFRDSEVAGRARAFRRDGQSGSATILSVKYTGTIVNRDQEYELKLARQDSQQVMLTTPVAVLNVPRIQPGQVVPILLTAAHGTQHRRRNAHHASEGPAHVSGV